MTNNIKGFRVLTGEEIQLINKIKEHGEATRQLLDEIEVLREYESNILYDSENVKAELAITKIQESLDCLDSAKAFLQTGQMWLVRSVALPDTF